MARSKGSFGLAGAVEPKAAAPLDARAVVKNMGELTAVGSFPYPYIGMETYVVSEGKKYRLIGNDPTVSANWEEVGVGGGHTIEDPEGTALTQRDTLQFGGDLEVSDDDENEKTVVSPHELTAAELAEIVTPLPSVPVNMPILFDESGAEYQVGWYRLTNGTKKPVYERAIHYTESDGVTGDWNVICNNDFNVSFFLDAVMINKDSTIGLRPTCVSFTPDGNKIQQWLYDSRIKNDDYVIIRYTKTTDTPT